MAQQQASDADLVQRLGEGEDGEAAAEIYRRMAPRVRLYGLRHLRDEAAAQDLVQQVLILTLEALREGRLREADKLGSFVLGTCRMTVLNQKRGAARREQLLKQYGADLPQSVQPTAPSLDGEKLAECVQGLRERERSVIVMSFYDEADDADVAGCLGVTQPNVRVIRHRAIRQLRTCLGVAG